MAKGKKTGGRSKGTPNKATQDVVALIDELAGPGAVKCFEQLATLALQPHDNVKARLVANQTLIAYRHGKPTEHVALDGDGKGGPVLVKFIDVDTAA
jgi:hypothetical protein